MAQTIFGALGLDKIAIKPVSATEFATKAQRHANSSLDCSLLRSQGIETPGPWEDSLRSYSQEFLDCLADEVRGGLERK